ncbi:restriction endonuclease [Cupriavidus lacunae]|uniref:Restriction endonuclease n=1 Tax=Cupriavidus lacunae TaxID=2666307 RepID=A0A370NU48_9BURK|nr:restriction endonuclease [Cupriavidus lacunae]
MLRANLDAVLAGPAKSATATNWYSRLDTFLRQTQAAVPEKLRDRVFLSRLWDDNPVSAVGNGTIRMAPALDNDEFVDWFAGRVSSPLPNDLADAEACLTVLYDEASKRLGVLCGRTPRLKLNRVLCALFPDFFTTIADVGVLLFLHREMGGSRKDHPVHAHVSLRRRIDEVLEPVDPSDRLEQVRRMCLPWLLSQRLTNEELPEQPASVDPTESDLKPLPAALRRKGLTAMKGGFQTLLSFLPALDEGLTREEFSDLISQANSELAPQSIGTSINVVMREFDLCRREGDIYRLSPRGINLLDSQDPQELADHLLTRVLGVDHVLQALSHEPKAKRALVALLQQVNPGWTSDFAPTSLLGWLVSIDVVRLDAERKYQLSERGRRWREMVTWEPERLPKPASTIEELEITVDKVQLPTWPDLSVNLQAIVDGRLSLDETLVKQLHAGLWFHPVRHFAVLTGISGSGKTQLALNYGLALCGEQTAGQETVKVVPIQPGWFDPSPLLGYVNPIQQSAYRSAPFLELLLRAAENPSQPYVVVLDEMNLSHPEQYLAPILSAMETQGVIDLHQLAEGTSEIPRCVRYPANLAIIGTVNMDETTHGLSDKVLDRAFTLEFWNIKVSDFPRWENIGLPAPLRHKAQAVLEKLGQVLAPVRLHFGWRTIDDVLSYLLFAARLGTTDAQALDDALYAKVLPKLRGESSKRFEGALHAAREVMKEHALLRCYEKLGDMQKDLAESGSARFWR